MDQQSILQDVISIMRNDSSTCKDTAGPDPDRWLSALKTPVSSRRFVFLVNQYLSYFGLDGHLRFANSAYKRQYLKVHEYQKRLFVDDDRYAPFLKRGDEIVRIDGKTPAESYHAYACFFQYTLPQRRSIVWSSLMQYTGCLDIVSPEGKSGRCCWDDAPDAAGRNPYEFRKITDDVFYVRLDDFSQAAEIQELTEKNAAGLQRTPYLIIDVRGNTGGADIAFLPLLTYAFPSGKELDECLKDPYPVEINYSVRNCDQRILDLQQYLDQGTLEESTRLIVNKMKEELAADRGKGFITVPDTPTGLCGRGGPERICILTDEFCASSGDAFASLISRSPKAVLIGRPTMGITDYSNCTTARWGTYRLQYPTSRDTRIDHGQGLAHRGVPVDILVPWTPQEFTEDPELKMALDILQDKTYPVKRYNG